MSSLREQVIARIYEECADFPERTGVSEEDACAIASRIGTTLWQFQGGIVEGGFYPHFYVRGRSVYVDWRYGVNLPERLIEVYEGA